MCERCAIDPATIAVQSTRRGVVFSINDRVATRICGHLGKIVGFTRDELAVIDFKYIRRTIHPDDIDLVAKGGH